MDEHGNVVGVVSAKLSAAAALAASGSRPENVNYAVKSSYLLKLTRISAGSVGEAQRTEREGKEI